MRRAVEVGGFRSSNGSAEGDAIHREQLLRKMGEEDAEGGEEDQKLDEVLQNANKKLEGVSLSDLPKRNKGLRAKSGSDSAAN